MRTTLLAALATLTALVLPVTLAAGTAAAVETCDGKVPTIVVPPRPPNQYEPIPVTGTPGDDVVLGSDDRDVIDGAGGNDTICGLEGADTITGGPGDDRLFAGLDDPYEPDDGYTGDLVVPGRGNDHVDLGADPSSAHVCICDVPVFDQVSYAGSTAGVTVDLTTGVARGEGADTIAIPEADHSAGIIGSPHDDVLIGSEAHDHIDAGGGDDIVEGRGADDTIGPDRAGRTTADGDPYLADSLPGDDTVDAGEGNDSANASLGRDRFAGGAGKDYLTSTSSAPGVVLDGGTEADTLTARLGATLRGGAGKDELRTRLDLRHRTRLDGGTGRDLVRLRGSRSVFGSGSRLVVDVPRERVHLGDRGVARYVGTEALFLGGFHGRLTFVGGPRADRVWATGRLRVRALGHGGADDLAGGSFDDHLDGGPGRDSLYGAEGRDTCLRGELVDTCEVRR